MTTESLRPSPPSTGAHSNSTVPYATPATAPRWQERLQSIFTTIGGWPRVLFALGLGSTLAGIGMCFDLSGDASAFFLLGGTLLGLTLRVPLVRW